MKCENRRRDGAIITLLLAACASLEADDVVVVATGGDAQGQLRKTGKIIEYTGKELRLRRDNGREMTIPTSRVIDIETAITPEHLAADRFFDQRQFASADEYYRLALQKEQRTWMRRRVIAQRVWCSRNLDQIDRAGDMFLVVLQSDPSTQYFSAIPLNWRTVQPRKHVTERARAWLMDENVAASRLMGASWLWATDRKPQSWNVLRQLASESDVRIARVAVAQCWRASVVSSSKAELVKWQTALMTIPDDLRAGPYFIIGQALLRHRESEAAALASMHVPILYPRHRRLASECLLTAGRALEQIGAGNQAATVYREILAEHERSDAASIAKARIQRLNEQAR